LSQIRGLAGLFLRKDRILLSPEIMNVSSLVSSFHILSATLQLGQVAPGVPTFTPERTVASSAAVVGLISAIIGGLALRRAAGRVGPGHGRRGAIVALVMGPIAVVIGGVVVATAKGGLGTGHGLAGGVVATMLGLIGTTLGGLALARSRRTR
jgi:hypothetical protein